ncbi:hypothetical protein FQR65_LT20930 [Abscondita terminalis]|nr:hypothetical protein FQR65_LT20930 [Abscondita terminalis]
MFDEALLRVLEKYEEITNLILPTLGEERKKDYSPFLPICPKTNKVLQAKVVKVNEEKGTIVYINEDNEEIETKVTGGACKLQWKVDWAMRLVCSCRINIMTFWRFLTHEFGERSGIEVSANLEQVELPESTQLTVYRIVQESLTNIGKYAKASHVLVSLHNYPTYVTIQIQDDGEGFETSSMRPNSHGLAGMRHRVEAAGGRLTVSSELGKGTVISAVIPLTPASS